MEESQSTKGRPPIEPTALVHQMIDPRKTPVYVEGRTDDEDQRPFTISSWNRKRKKKIAVDRMQLSDGDQDFFGEDSNDEGGSNVPEKRTCVSLSDEGGECGSKNFSYNGNDQSRVSGVKGNEVNDNHPLIILRCVGGGSFGNPTKTLKWFNESIFA